MQMSVNDYLSAKRVIAVAAGTKRSLSAGLGVLIMSTSRISSTSGMASKSCNDMQYKYQQMQ